MAIIRQEAAEQRALLLSEANAEVQALRGEVHTLQLGSSEIPGAVIGNFMEISWKFHGDQSDK